MKRRFLRSAVVVMVPLTFIATVYAAACGTGPEVRETDDGASDASRAKDREAGAWSDDDAGEDGPAPGSLLEGREPFPEYAACGF